MQLVCCDHSLRYHWFIWKGVIYTLSCEVGEWVEGVNNDVLKLELRPTGLWGSFMFLFPSFPSGPVLAPWRAGLWLNAWRRAAAVADVLLSLLGCCRRGQSSAVATWCSHTRYKNSWTGASLILRLYCLGETIPCSPHQQKAVAVVCRSSDASSHREHTSSCAESQKMAAPTGSPIEGCDREDGCEGAQDSVCYSQRKWNLSNETAAHSRPRWRTNAPSATDPHFTSRAPPRPTEREH